MSFIDFLKKWLRPPEWQREEDSSTNYPTYDWEFVHSITWRCSTCENEIYWMDSDDRLTCHYCDTRYSLEEDEFPELLRAKCWNCGNISDNVGGFRLENIVFDCPHCDFEWKSSPY